VNQVIIIGTEPPCPRCGLLTQVFKEMVATLGLDARVEHISYSDTAAAEFAAGLGLTAGTAKDVALRMGAELNLQQVKDLVENAVSDPGCVYSEFNSYNWTRDLDQFLKPYELEARHVGILMTPVIIINGKLKHNGSVPAMQEITRWLEELTGQPKP
jgi:predicted DsbA family dithiol-disulfide isomerase